jgi:ABC-type nitrate/sulfonate/bicarbonate transport system substrate-binding protein
MPLSNNDNRRGRPKVLKDHGTTARHAQGCRCEPCKLAWNDYQRTYRARPDVAERRAEATAIEWLERHPDAAARLCANLAEREALAKKLL